jgi:hypothetical protein
MSSTDVIASSRIVPWMNSPTPSTASAPPTVVSDVPCRTNTAINAPSRLMMVTGICTAKRSSRGTNASISTPTHAAPSTMKIGTSAW